MKTLKDIKHLDGVKVLVRADFNVPVSNGKVVDDYRIRMTLPTIEYLLDKGAKVILISHLESNDGDNMSLSSVSEHLNKIGVRTTFIPDYMNAYEMIENGDDGSKCFLLENLRYFEDEKSNDPKFARELASLGDIYVNEAFSVSHRKHASIVGVPKLMPSYAGLQLEEEVNNLSKAFNPDHPFVFILGGAKFDTKLPLLEKFIDKADTLFVGGALANNFFKEKGYSIGASLVSDGDFQLSRFVNSTRLMIPLDVLNEKGQVKMADKLDITDKNIDVGPATLKSLKEKIASAKFILWNGPVGLYEKGFEKGTIAIAEMIGSASANGAVSIVGGGDTIAAIEKVGNKEQFTFISTGGGAMLEFLGNGSLPGIAALN